MATAKLPYMLSSGLIAKILAKIQEARRPERFTQDFLETKLGHSGGSAMAFVPLLKRMGFLASDGVPTRLYDRFRNTTTQGAAMAEGMRAAYSELFERNEYAYEMPKEKLTSLIVEITYPSAGRRGSGARGSCSGAGGGGERRPVPGQQLIEQVHGMLGDARQHVGEPGQWIDVIELGGVE